MLESAQDLCTQRQESTQPRSQSSGPEEMPEIARFLGIVVRMYYRDHNPPHFHARYGAYAIIVHLESRVVEGRFPPRALHHVLEWAEQHHDELQEDWELARSRRPLKPIPPLE